MKLTVIEQRRVAQRANWFFDLYGGQGTADSVVYTGDGVDDLDRLIAVINNTTARGNKLVCDVSPGNFSEYKLCDVEDVEAIKMYYIGWYGTVSKQNVYDERQGVALPTQQIEVIL